METASAVGKTTKSIPWLAASCSPWCLKLSLINRFRRFLPTALRQLFLETAIPNRQTSLPLLLPKTLKYVSREDFGPENTKRKSSCVFRRCLGVNRIMLVYCLLPGPVYGSKARLTVNLKPLFRLVGSGRKAFAAFGATCIENSATTAGCHARPKTMSASPL